MRPHDGGETSVSARDAACAALVVATAMSTHADALVGVPPGGNPLDDVRALWEQIVECVQPALFVAAVDDD